MICPQTKWECDWKPLCEGMGSICKIQIASPKPPPDMAEIERLVDAFESAIDHVHYFESVEHVNNQVAARAALMAAIRKLAEKKDA